MPCLVSSELKDPALDLPAVKRDGQQLLKAWHLGRAELSILFVDDPAIRVLNRDYRQKDRPTDVLSFPQDGLGELPAGEPRILGDVVISLPTARRQARERHRGLGEELRRLLVHGFLHLLGHDHEEDDEARVMAAEERKLRALLERVHPRPRRG
ncbi:MAG: rRNA maturation RNase YbeY [Deltaproteobacteria bacterium]|nr:rRNA maturation RNase YbeY [Deltaproteobacteria bacterium]